MKPIDVSPRWVGWNDEDRIYIGKGPDLITGIHGDDPVQVDKELGEVVQGVIDHFQRTGRKLPPANAADDGSLPATWSYGHPLDEPAGRPEPLRSPPLLSVRQRAVRNTRRT